MRKPAKVQLSLGKSVKRLEEISTMTGIHVKLAPDASFVLRPGEGKLFKVAR
jgi:hypothetical protein